jgi:hypothetical protein
VLPQLGEEDMGIKVEATNVALRVDYRTKGKEYSQSNALQEGSIGINNAERSDYPFDSADLQPGEHLIVNGDVVRVVEYTPVAEPGETGGTPE